MVVNHNGWSGRCVSSSASLNVLMEARPINHVELTLALHRGVITIIINQTCYHELLVPQNYDRFSLPISDPAFHKPPLLTGESPKLWVPGHPCLTAGSTMISHSHQPASSARLLRCIVHHCYPQFLLSIQHS